MASSAQIEGSLPDAGDNSTTGIIFSGGWGVWYDFSGSPPFRLGQPSRLSSLGWPAPYDRDLAGALRGRAGFSPYLYLFKGGSYLRLDLATMTPTGPETDTASSWGLPADWTSIDAVTPGRGSKIESAYFFRGSQYIRYDWTTDSIPAGYPKDLGTEWHIPAPLNANLDGVVAGQGAFGATAYPFRTLAQSVDDNGALGGGPPPHAVNTPGFARFDYNSGSFGGIDVSPPDVVSRWGGLLPLLDAGPAIDLAIDWCDKGLAALAGPSTPLLLGALQHHFKTSTPSAPQVAAITAKLTAIRARLALLPNNFQWTRNLNDTANTVPGTLTQIGDDFSIGTGPNGRAAIMVHEAVHFVFTGGIDIDVPEWSGETIQNRSWDIAGGMAYSALSVDQSMANPSSYAAFVQEIANGSDTRYGFGRRNSLLTQQSERLQRLDAR